MSLEISVESREDAGLFNAGIQKYNSHYFSVLFSLPGPGGRSLASVNCRGGEWQATDNPSAYEWARHSIRFLDQCEKRAWIIINGPTDVLGRTRISGEKLSALRDRPIAIYLYEPLFFLKDDGSREYWRAMDPRQNDFLSAELDSILAFNENHGGELDITVYSCDQHLQRITKNHPKYKSLRIKTFDIFLTQYVSNLTRNPDHMRFRFTKAAICLNFRYDFFREIVVAYLRARNYHLRSFLTYYHAHSPAVFSHLPFSFTDWGPAETIRKGIEAMQTELPYSLEARGATAVCPSQFDIPDLKAGANRRREEKIGKYYENAFVSIVNETRYFSYCPNVSEKTLNSFFYFRPAILVAPPGTLQYVRELGFKTFEGFWDEGYDFELNHSRRFERIFSLIDAVFAQPKARLEEMLWDMQPILYHNRLRLLDFPQYQMNAISADN